ncbi:MAG: tetratricopeptide repeat protein [Blastocatellales bacterium]
MTNIRLYSLRKVCAALGMGVLGALSCLAQTDEMAMKSRTVGEPSIERLIDQGRLPEARAKLCEQITKEGESPRLLLFEAMILYRENNYSDSLRKLERAINLNNADPDVYKLIGLNLVAGGRDDLAGSYFEKAVELAPRDFMARYYLGLHQLTSKQFKLAAASAQTVIKLNPGYLDGYLVLGVAQEQLGKETDAIQTYRQACKIAQQHQYKTETPFLYLARLLISLQQFEQSLPPLKKALAINPNLAEAHTLCGQTLSRFGQYEQAIQSLQEAVRLAPQEKSPHYLLMGIYQKLGKTDEARQEMQIFRALEEKEKQK